MDLEYGDEHDDDEDYYEEYLGLDEEIKSPVPQDLLDSLPVNQFTEANRENFSEEN